MQAFATPSLRRQGGRMRTFRLCVASVFLARTRAWDAFFSPTLSLRVSARGQFGLCLQRDGNQQDVLAPSISFLPVTSQESIDGDITNDVSPESLPALMVAPPDEDAEVAKYRKRCILLEAKLLEILHESKDLKQSLKVAESSAAKADATVSKLRVQLKDARSELLAAEKYIEGLKAKYAKEMRVLEIDTQGLQRTLRQAEEEMSTLREKWKESQSKLEAESLRYRTRNVLLTEELRKSRERAKDAWQVAAWLEDEKASLSEALTGYTQREATTNQLRETDVRRDSGTSAVGNEADLCEALEETVRLQEELSQSRSSAAEREIYIVRLEGELRHTQDTLKKRRISARNSEDSLKRELEQAKHELNLLRKKGAEAWPSERSREAQWRNGARIEKSELQRQRQHGRGGERKSSLGSKQQQRRSDATAGTRSTKQTWVKALVSLDFTGI